MLHFIHTYTELAFPAIVKSGLWHDGDGLKLMHKPDFVPPYDFNSQLAVEAPLRKLLRELKCLFYIDRLQGGMANTKTYPYNPALLSDLREELRENFLGFQMHEWASNLRSDIQRILAQCKNEAVDANNHAGLRELFSRVQTGESSLFLEAYTPQEWAEHPAFFDLASYLKEAHALYSLRSKETYGMLLPADSYYMAFKTEITFGARLLLPEVGWQIPNMRLQIAYARGMANGAGIPWGIYYECWQNSEPAGFTIPFALRSGQDEWLEDLLHKGGGCDRSFEEREYGGSSLSLLSRAWRYAWFSGAWAIAEEYGVCNTFRDLGTAELSPYGDAKKEFLCFADSIKDIGEPYKPIAAVLPKDLPMLDVRLPEQWYDYSAPEDSPPRAEIVGKINEALSLLFGEQGSLGNCGHVLKNGDIPDVIDIIHADTPSLSSYEYLLDLTGDPLFAQAHHNTVPIGELRNLLATLLPFSVENRVHTVYNRTREGWLVLCMNHNGVQHDAFCPDRFIPEAEMFADIRFYKSCYRLQKIAGTGCLEANDGAWCVTLGAGEWILISAY